MTASTLREGSIDILDVPVDRPLAVMIGTELTGLTQAAHDMADITFFNADVWICAERQFVGF